MPLQIDGKTQAVPAGWHEESLLTVLREALGLVGAKLGCASTARATGCGCDAPKWASPSTPRCAGLPARNSASISRSSTLPCRPSPPRPPARR